jgi:hypothetical protein
VDEEVFLALDDGGRDAQDGLKALLDVLMNQRASCKTLLQAAACWPLCCLSALA